MTAIYCGGFAMALAFFFERASTSSAALRLAEARGRGAAAARVHPRGNKVHASISDRPVTFPTQRSMLQNRYDRPLTVATQAA